MKKDRIFIVIAFFLNTIMMRADDGTRSGAQIIKFKDPLVKEICVSLWDKNGDGELSMEDAAEVTDISNVFYGKKISTFDEFEYFKNVRSLNPHIDEVIPGFVFVHGAFESCNELLSITLPAQLDTIGYFSFAHCLKLKTVTIPRSVKEIEHAAFFNCKSLETIVSLISNPFSIHSDVFGLGEINVTTAWGKYDFLVGRIQFQVLRTDILSLPGYTSIYKSAKLYVPDKTKSEYESLLGWKEFMYIV